MKVEFEAEIKLTYPLTADQLLRGASLLAQYPRDMQIELSAVEVSVYCGSESGSGYAPWIQMRWTRR